VNIWRRFLNRISLQKPNADRAPFYGRTQAGIRVDQDNALKYAAVWGCVNVISKSIAILPWTVFEKTRTGRESALEHPVNWLLHKQPNPEMTPFHFKQALMSHVLTWGNGYAEIERDGMGRPVWLWPITPDRVTPDRNEAGEIIYRVWNGPAGAESRLAAANVLHIRGLGFDGLVGYSVIKMAAESIGLGLAMQDFGSSFFGNGAHIGGILTHPQQLSPEARKNLEESFKRKTGSKNALGIFVAEEGMKYEKMGIPPNDAQFLESRTAQVLDICRWYGVPPHKLAELGRATWANIESQGIEFVTDTLQSWITQFVEEANIKLFGRQQRGVFYTKFNLAALLRGDMTSRFNAYAVAHNNGWMSANDIRGLEELNPIKDGDLYIVPANMVTREQMKKGPQPQQPSNPKPEPEAALAASLKKLNGQHPGNGHA
jgi:HK97 family phage portal protein